MDFANAIGCGNMVFGCPKNRVIDHESDEHIAIEFFRLLGDYAKKCNTVLAIEPNTVIYGTNFLNYN